MTSTPILDRLAGAVRAAREAQSDPLLELAASDAAGQLRKLLPDVDPGVLGAVLMHIGMSAEQFLRDAPDHGPDDECPLGRFADLATVAGVQLYGGAR
jgi:hypothetical protein